MTTAIEYATVSVSREFGCGLAGWFWHGVAHEAAIRVSCGGHPEAGLGLEGPLQRWPLTQLLAGPQRLSLWETTQEHDHGRQGSPGASWGHLPERKCLQVPGAICIPHGSIPTIHSPGSLPEGGTPELRLPRLTEDREEPRTSLHR